MPSRSGKSFSRRGHLLGLVSMGALLGTAHSASALLVAPATGSATLVFGGVSDSLTEAYALVVMHGSVGTGYYLDNPVVQGPASGTGGLISLGALPAGTDSFTVNYQYASYETPVGVIIAASDPGLDLNLGVSNAFLNQNPAWISSATFAAATSGIYVENESTIASSINSQTPGSDPFLNALGDLPLATSAFIPFAANSTGTLVAFPQIDGDPNGTITVNPTAAAPLPSAFWAGLIGIVGLAFLQRSSKAGTVA